MTALHSLKLLQGFLRKKIVMPFSLLQKILAIMLKE